MHSLLRYRPGRLPCLTESCGADCPPEGCKKNNVAHSPISSHCGKLLLRRWRLLVNLKAQFIARRKPSGSPLRIVRFMDTLLANGKRLLLAAFLGLGIGGGVLSRSHPGAAESSQRDTASLNAAGDELSSALYHASQSVFPSLVLIESWRGSRQTYEWRNANESAFSQAAGLAPNGDVPPASGDSQGTGIIIGGDGLILTAAHLVASADAVLVHLHDGQTFVASDVKADPATDLAVLSISGAGDLPEAPLGDSGRVRVGEWVMMIGHPYGLTGSVSAGVISAKDRRLPGLSSTLLLQMDAATNPGSSGGPLVDLHGRVIGVDVGSVGHDRGFEGIGFAVPINTAKRIAHELAVHGRVRRSYVGCDWQALTPELAEAVGLDRTQGGVLVCGVDPGSPADDARLRAGDVVAEFDGAPIGNLQQLQCSLEEAPPGTQHSFTVLRSIERVTLRVNLKEARAAPARPVAGAPLAVGDAPTFPPAAQSRSPDEQTSHRRECVVPDLGLSVADLLPSEAAVLGLGAIGPAVLVTDVPPGAGAYFGRLCAGMAILQVGNKRVRNVEEFKIAIREQSGERGFFLLTATSEGNHFLAVKGRARTSE